MDQERTLLIVAVGVAVAVGCFVLWGPSTFRSKRKKGHVLGLVNLGHTCFLNTLLQALASCPSVIDWLLHHKSDDQESLVSALRTVLLILNGENDSVVGDSYPPIEVLAALKRHNWMISPGEQDAHELFHVLLETLEEEMTSSSVKNISLSDILLPENYGQEEGDNANAVHIIKRNSLNVKSKCDGDGCGSSAGPKFLPMRRIRLNENSSAVPSVAIRRHLPQFSQSKVLPLRGMLTSQLMCTQCGFKSALRFDKFDTLSLPLPMSARKQHLTLQMLLDNFVSTEVVKDVTCSNCSKKCNKPTQTTAMKTLNFGKLPVCLCLHIVRTTWNKDGSPWKRDDFVDFPEFLVMDNYTHSQVQRNERRLIKSLNEQIEDKDSTQCSRSSVKANGELQKESNVKVVQEPTQYNQLPASNAKHLYRLKAVVVHTGDVHSGHFITYRKGPVKSLIRHRLFSDESNMEHLESRESARWFYTSDMVVRRVTLCDALLSNAYMLFYEKCAPKIDPLPKMRPSQLSEV